jgi:hypothetical protein
MQCLAEIWHQSENIQAHGNFSNLIGEKSQIQRQRVKQKWTSHTWILSRVLKCPLLIHINNSRLSCYVYVSVQTLKIDLIYMYIARRGPWCP